MATPRAGLWLVALLAAACAPRVPDSLVLVSLDTVRSDRLGSYGSRRGVTPRLDALASEAIRFADVTVQTPLTAPSHASILTGLLPPRHGVRDNERFALRAEARTLAETLRAGGYRTGAFVAAFPLRASLGFGRGFDVYDDEFLKQGRQAERRADAVLERALPFVLENAAAGRPFFAFVHLFDAHSPYAAPEPFSVRHAGDPYDGEIAYLDDQLGRFLDRLRAARVLERALVSILADHGEALGEHGENTHGALLYEPTLRVPWLVRLPGGRLAGRSVPQPVRAVDVAPTLLGWLGVRAPGALDGVDLSRGVERDAVPGDLPGYAESLYLHLLLGWGELRSLRRGALKLIDAPRVELYDLARDPGEAEDLTLREAARAAPLLAELRALRGREPAASSRAPSAEAAQRLASLGYASGASRPGAVPRNPADAMDVWREIEAGTTLLAQDRGKARSHFERALAKDPGNGLALKSLGDVAYEDGNAREAARRYAASREAGFAHPDLDLAEARARAALGEAAEALLSRLPAAPEWQLAAGTVLNELGTVLAERGRREEAAARFREAMQRAPSAAEPRRNLALLHADAEAEGLLREALLLRPSYPEARTDLAKLLARTGRARAAAGEVQQALAARPDDPEALFVAARISELLGRPAEARAAYRRFLQLAPQALQEPRRLAQQRLEAIR